MNMFGITETTVHVTAYEICAGHQEEEVCPEANAESVIGSALPGLRTYALDASLRQVPEGLHRRAVCGRSTKSPSGYSGKPALTATRVCSRTRLRRFGDVSQWRPWCVPEARY